MKTFKESLSTRCKNGLLRCFGPDSLDNPMIIISGWERLKLTNQIGPKSLQEIASLLSKFECKDNNEYWNMVD